MKNPVTLEPSSSVPPVGDVQAVPASAGLELNSATASSAMSRNDSGTGFNVTVASDFLTVLPLRSEWDALVAAHGAAVYMSYDWTRTWWEFYGAGRKLRLFLFYFGPQLVGVLPVYIDRLGFGPFQFSVARLVCSNIPPKAFNPPLDARFAAPAFEALLDQLLVQDRCDLISLGPISGNREYLAAFHQVARGRSDIAGKVTLDREGVHTVFELPASMDDFFARMDKDERKKRKYEMRLLAREKEIQRDVLTDPAQVEQEFHRFAEMHALQWRDKGKLGHFGSWPRGGEYNLALVKTLAAAGRVRFVRILADGQVISSQYAFVFGDTWYWELPARLMDRQWNRFSLGTTGFFCLVEEAIKEGCRHIEAGIAHYDYKQKLGGAEQPMNVLRVVSRRSGSRLRIRLYGLLRRCLEVLYYKIWYARISPRLPAAFRKPIWPFWLRLDF